MYGNDHPGKNCPIYVKYSPLTVKATEIATSIVAAIATAIVAAIATAINQQQWQQQ